MAKRKNSDRKQTQTNANAKTTVSVRVDSQTLRDLDRMAELRGSSRTQLLQQAIEFYTWMVRGGAAVQIFEPWADPDLQNAVSASEAKERPRRSAAGAKPPSESPDEEIGTPGNSNSPVASPISIRAVSPPSSESGEYQRPPGDDQARAM